MLISTFVPIRFYYWSFDWTDEHVISYNYCGDNINILLHWS